MLAPVEARRGAADEARRRLCQAVGDSRVVTDRDALEPYARDESEAVGHRPEAVVLAETPEHILATLAVARETGVPVTPRAGGTSRTGGAAPLAGGIVLVTLGMNQIKELDPREGLAVVEPGVLLADFHHEVERTGLMYPPDPSSKVGCTVGGNVATNAGGPRAFKYGVTGDYVLGVEAFLVGGERLRVGRRTAKGVTGYDMTSLLVGSEGTLAVLGDITLRLVGAPESIMTLLVLFEDEHQAGGAVGSLIAAGVRPRCLELLDRLTLQAIRDAGNSIDERAGAMLIIEVDGDEASCEREASRIAEVCESDRAFEVLVAADEGQRQKLWAARKNMSYAVRKLARNKLSEDVAVPRQQLPTLLARIAEIRESEGVTMLAYGHAGDGNLHVNLLWDDPPQLAAVHRAIARLFREVVALGGTLSGEHGLGALKAPYLPLEQSPELIALQQSVKATFDPKGLLNPGKVFPSPYTRAVY